MKSLQRSYYQRKNDKLVLNNNKVIRNNEHLNSNDMCSTLETNQTKSFDDYNGETVINNNRYVS